MKIGEHQTTFVERLSLVSGVSEGYAIAAWYTLSTDVISNTDILPEELADRYYRKYFDV